MDSQTHTPEKTSPISSQHDPVTSQPHSNQSKKILLIIGIIVGLLIVGFGGYFVGKQNSKQPPQPQLPTESPTMTTPTTQATISPTAIPQDAGIPIQANTVSFTRVNGTIYLRYKGKIYNEEAANKNDASLTNLPTPDNYTWYGLVDAPAISANTGFDELFDFKVFPNRYNFVFIMRWPIDDTKTDYKVFSYDAFAPNNKVSLIYTSTQANNGNEYPVPRIRQVSTDGNYIAFSLFACWNCGGHIPNTMLYNMVTKATKQIGKVSYFTWKDKGAYEYKEYKAIPCVTPLEGHGECSEDPNSLPIISGVL